MASILSMKSIFNYPKNNSLILKIGWLFCIVGLLCILLSTIIFIVNCIYEVIFPPRDMYFFGLVTTIMIFYVAPVGGIVLLVGGAMGIVDNRFARKDNSTKRCT